MEIRRADERGKTETDWLESYHSFSFGRYRDPDNTNIGPLRVLNEDFIDPGQGFGKHSHDNMEIVTYVLEGALEHEDSAGGGGVIEAGQVQFMRAGSGVRHSEMNASDEEPCRLLQIWFVPRTRDMDPTYGKIEPDVGSEWTPLAGEEGEIEMDTPAQMYAARIPAGEEMSYSLDRDQAYLFVIDGKIQIDGEELEGGDAAHVREEIEGEALEDSHLLLFDLGEL